MGFFNLFSKEQKAKNDRARANAYAGIKAAEENDKKGPVAVFSPTSFADVEYIIDSIKSGKNTVVHLTELTDDTAVRVLDMLAGAVYALGGGVYEMGKNIFMFSPSGVEVF